MIGSPEIGLFQRGHPGLDRAVVQRILGTSRSHCLKYTRVYIYCLAYEILVLLAYSKTYVKWQIKKRQNKDRNDKIVA